MANKYVRSGAGGAATGADWANAYLTLAAAASGSAAGDDIWVAGDHAETQASAMTITFPGTDNSPNRVFCVSHAGSVPPVAADLLTTATVTTTGTSNMTLSGAAYIYGITFNVGTSTGLGVFSTSSISNGQTFERCAINLVNTNSSSNVNAQCVGLLDLIDTTMSFGAVGQRIGLNAGTVRWRGSLSSIAGSVFPTTLFAPIAGKAGICIVDGVDLSSLGSGKSLVQTGAAHGYWWQFINCRLNASVTTAGVATAAGSVLDLVNCDSGTLNYRNERYQHGGSLTTESTIVRTGGASDGVTTISHKIVTSANAKRARPFEAFPIVTWVDTTGASKTATIELVNDGVTLTSADVWVEASYLGSASYPLASVVSSAPATPLTAGSNLATSSETWTTTGLASPVKQYLTVTFTTEMKGYVRFHVKVARASTTLYLDPEVTIV